MKQQILRRFLIVQTKCRRAGVIKQINHNHELIKKIYQLFLAYC